jgi:hypothetical protein
VSNIGFGPDATHTVDSDSIWANSVVGEMKEIVNPGIFRTDISADEYTMRKMFNEGKRFWIYFKKITSWIRRLKG